MTRLLARAAGVAWVLTASVFLVAAAARADDAFSFENTPGKLPKTVVPVHYALDLQSDLEKLTVAGSAVIDVEVREPTDRIVLNAVSMTFAAATLDGAGPASDISVDKDAQTVTLTFARPIAAGRHTLRIAYSAQINKFGRGVYLIDYRTDEGRKRMIASHSEPADARRIFPGWDEPAFKATFELTVTVPQRFLAVSNMPIARELSLSNGRKRVSFERTPRMSTYLFVLVAGELERITAEAEGVTIGAVTTRGKSANGRYAIEEAVKLLKYFNDYFDSKYPLPKLDLIALPSNTAAAMEHWGGITFFEGILLYDPATSPLDVQRRVFSVLAHEMAHQWLGNLVTTAWWNDLWLNEGFASWMQYKAAEKLHPEWQPWLNSSGAKQGAMARDAQRTARAIRRPVANETEARVVFDAITYSKGQAVVRMLEAYLGEDTFREAMRRYMKERAYSNATTADLWRALDWTSGKAVGAMASAYTEQPGVPLVIADIKCVGSDQTIVLKQDRFTVRDADARPQSWKVPVMYGPPGSAQPETILLDGAAEIAAGRCGDAIKLNLGDVGYYRVRYDAAMQGALAGSLATMAPADRVNLLADAWALVEAHRNPPSAYFELADRLAGDDNRTVADQVVRTLTRLDHLQRGRPGRAAFQAYARATLRPTFERLGWQAADGESNDRVLLRASLIRTLGDLGDEAVLADAKRRFDAFLTDSASLPANLRGPVTHLVGRTADRAGYETLLGLARKSTKTEERVRYYSAAASALDPAFARETLAIALTDELPADLAGRLINWVAGEHAALALALVKENFEALAAKQGPSFRNTFVSNLMANFSDRARAEELKDFAPAYETSGGRMVAERVRERIVADAEFVQQQLPAIDEWVRRRGAP
jgi:aminopeptidase N